MIVCRMLSHPDQEQHRTTQSVTSLNSFRRWKMLTHKRGTKCVVTKTPSMLPLSFFYLLMFTFWVLAT